MRNLMITTRTFGIAALALLTTISGCSSDAAEGQTTQGISGPSVTTDQAQYDVGGDVVVSFTNTSGMATDWITLAKTGDAPSTYEAWSFTDGSTAGTVTFSAPPLTAGSYEARMFYDWDGTHAYTVEATSSFTVGSSIATDHSSYASSDTITVSFTGLPGNLNDWIAIAPQGAPNTTFSAWSYTNGATAGTATFSGLDAGTYVARSFVDDGYTLVSESSAFTVGAGTVVVATSQSAYTSTDHIIVNFSGLTADATDWIALTPAGSPNNTYTFWQYTSGSASGSIDFAPIPSGNWEARAFYHDGFTLAGSTTFTVGGNPAVSTDMASYSSGSVITLSYSALPGNPKDWIAISAAGSDPSSYIEWVYTDGATSGSHMFTGLPAGSYEARAYSNDTFTVIATSQFAVTNGAAVSTDSSTYTTTSTVTVTYSGLPGNAKDWIAISVAGSADGSYLDYVYTGGMTSGTATFSNLPAGMYEARSYINDTFQVAGRSSSFDVQ